MVDEVVTAASVATLAAADPATLAAAAAPLHPAPSAAGGGGGATVPQSLATAALLAQLERLQALDQVRSVVLHFSSSFSGSGESPLEEFPCAIRCFRVAFTQFGRARPGD